MPAARCRLFFALFPDAATADRLARWAAGLQALCGRAGKPPDPARLHVTVHFLGEPGDPDPAIARARSAAGGLRASPVAVRLDRLERFAGGGRQPVVLLAGDGADLCELHRALEERLLAAGWPPDTRPYRPHLTLFRGATAVPAGHPCPAFEWIARELLLVQSSPGRERGYRALGRWPLDA